MTTEQTTRAITGLESQGHKFRLLPTGQVHVTNVTPQVRAFVTKFKDDIQIALAARQQEQLVRANFPDPHRGATVISRRTWEEIRQDWRDLVATEGMDKLLEMNILRRTLGEIRGCDNEDLVIELLSEAWDTAPPEVLQAFCFDRGQEQGVA